MNYIIFDLEATCWEDKHTEKVSEIIEIGAVMLNEYGEVIDEYCRFVRPVVHPNLSDFCMELTSIQQIPVNRADPYDVVVEDFQDWIGVGDEEYLLCSWGGFDKKMLKQDCRLYDMDTAWADKHINLKQQYKEIKRQHRPTGLRRAITREGFEFEGRQHRGITDAQNLVKIFTKFIDEWYF